MKRITTFILFLVTLLCVQAQDEPNCYRLYLTDKTGTPYSIDKPEQFLSARAIAKRARFNIPLTEEDLPVNPHYIRQILDKDHHIRILSQSKWTNTITIYCPDNKSLDSIMALNFVCQSKPVAHYRPYIDTTHITPFTLPKASGHALAQHSSWTPEEYGYAYGQIAMHHGDQLHAAGFKGKDMLIAVLDDGWHNFDKLDCFKPLFDNGQIIGSRDLLPGKNNLYDTEEAHGTCVTSIMATTMTDSLIGTAPEASYFFIRTENSPIEEPIEEDLWMMGAELADSLGADVINSSLGYTTFDDSLRYPASYAGCDGNSLVSQVAAKAVDKGIIVCISAGNSGNDAWLRISRPADARNVLTVGAVDIDTVRAPFSSIGPTYDSRIKPDVVALGSYSYIIADECRLACGGGTSFASPIMAGLSACLWQSLPHKNASEIIQIIKESGHLCHTPDIFMGYGIPDMYQAFLNHTTDIRHPAMPESQIDLFPNPCDNLCTLSTAEPLYKVQINIYNSIGQLMTSQSNIDIYNRQILDISSLKAGIYLLQISGYNQIGKRVSTFKKLSKK